MNLQAHATYMICLDQIKLDRQQLKKTIQKLNPQKIESEKISIIFDRRISKGILSVLASAISASSIARGTSFFKR